MPKFDKRFIHCVWDERLKEKRCFVADSIVELREAVESNDTKFIYTVVRQNHEDCPFEVEYGLIFTFCYYDPYYDLKLSYEQGKVIQVKNDFTGEWVDKNVDDIYWGFADQYEIRIKPEETKPEEKPVTNSELAQWLAEGYGQYRNSQIGKAKYHFEYVALEDDMPIHEDIRVRVWGDTEWHEPTREYMGLS